MKRWEAPPRSGGITGAIDRFFLPLPSTLEIAAWTAIVFGLMVLPPLFLEAASPHLFRPVRFFNAVAIMAAYATLVALIAALVTQSAGRALRVCAVAVLVVWWAEFRIAAESVSFVVPVLSISVIALFLFLTVSYAIVAYGRTVGVTVALGALVLVAGVSVSSSLFNETVIAQPPINGSSSTQPPHGDLPNVFVLILDGAPRGDVLRDLYKSDLSPYEESMRDLGAVTNPEAWSNYSRTYASVSGMLSLDYLVIPGRDPNEAFARVRGVLGGDGEFLRAFKDVGYELTFSTSPWQGSRCSDIIDHCLRPPPLRDNVYALLRSSLLAPIAPRIMDPPWTVSSLEQIRSIASVHARSSEGDHPSLTLMHAVLPHPPLALDGSCTVHRDAWRLPFEIELGQLRSEGHLDAYGDHVSCTLTTVARQFELLLESDPDAVVLIVSDHGPDGLGQSFIPSVDYDRAQVWERMAILTTFKGPPRCSDVSRSASVIGSFRTLATCITGRTYPPLDTRHFVVPNEAGLMIDEPMHEIEGELP